MKKNRLQRFFRRMHWLFTVYLWPAHEHCVNTWNGRLTFWSKDRTLGRSLYVEKSFEKDMMLKSIAFMESIGKLRRDKDSIMLDVGGYVGMISIGFVINNIFQKAMAFEPNPLNYSLLSKNLLINSVEDNIKAYNVALSDSSGTLTMELSDKNYGDHRVRSEEAVLPGVFGEEKREVIDIQSINLDQFLLENQDISAENISLVWMDIQGHEGKFLVGAREFFSHYQTVPVFMEFAPYYIERSGMSKEQFCNAVKGLFTYFYDMNENEPECYNINAIDAFYDSNNTPAGGTHLLLVN